MIVVDASAAVLGLLNDGDARRSLASEAVAVPHREWSELRRSDLLDNWHRAQVHAALVAIEPLR